MTTVSIWWTLCTSGPFGSGSLWHRYLERAWQGDLVKDLYISFTVGEVAGAVVGLVGYSTPVSTMDVCTWGHVVTQADQTGKGIATELTRASIEDFRSLSSKGSRAMFLSTGAKGAPRRVYEKCGMTAYGIVGRSAAMWLAMGDPAAFESDYYGDPGSLSMTDLKISDLPRVEALMSLPHWTVKSWTDGANGLRAFEGQFHELWRRTEAGLPCRVLRGSGERVFGITWLSESDAGRALDVVAHPSVENMAVRLVQKVVGGSDGVRAYTAEPDELRSRLLAAAGFTKEGMLEEPLELGELREEVTVWQRL